MATMRECLELPRPLHLLRTTGWNLFESFGLPLGGYALAASLWGDTAGVLAMLGAIWVTAVIRKLLTGSIPSLLWIALIVLTVQGVVAVATGNLWIFLIHFPLANLGLCILFGLSARGRSPLAEKLAGEVIGLRCPECHQASLRPFFEGVTWLWSGIFLLLAVSLGALLATVPIKTYVLIWAFTTIVLIGAGVGASVLWLRSVLRRLGIGFRFATVPAG
jgi:hypothetical protein